ncbi:MAG: arginase family protein [Desulfovibrionaceae bacterium]|nr:arginase family protein [Desulfovibrionaceae bacterium]
MQKKKTIRLLYPEWHGGALSTYYFGANLLASILPNSPLDPDPTFKVEVRDPNGIDARRELKEEAGIVARSEIRNNFQNAMEIIKREKPDRIITIGGDCFVSLAAFDYLHGIYKDELGILWVDAHPDVLTPNFFNHAHAMVLGTLLGGGDEGLRSLLTNEPFAGEKICYAGLQKLLPEEEAILRDHGVNYRIQEDSMLTKHELAEWIYKNSVHHLLVHFDVDVLSPQLFASTYFAHPTLQEESGSRGIMDFDAVHDILHAAEILSNIEGFTVAEYLPWSEEKLANIFRNLDFFSYF